MKKVFLLCTVICLLLVGCEKEGVYNPSKKIRRIEYQSQGGVKQLVSEWTWEKNLLKKIEYPSNFNEHFTYEKNRLTKVEESDGYYTKITYNGDLYDKIEYNDPSDVLLRSYKFTYENKKVSRIDITDYDGGYKSLPTDGFISHIISSKMITMMNEIRSKSKSKGEQTSRITFQYDKNNISESVLESNEEYFGDIYSYKEIETYEKYDNYENPTYHFYENPVSSKNNPLEVIVKETITVNGIGDTERSTISYEYEYDGKFPKEIRTKETYSDGSIKRYTIFMEYLK